MRNTSNPLGDGSSGNRPTFCGQGVILLSTWNGQAHLSEQLESLAAQTGMLRVMLSIRDDGSQDGTVDLIRTFCEAEKPGFSAKYSCGENIGFIGSFLELLRTADPAADWYAFCDQDDVWQPDKLERAVAMLRQAEAEAKDSEARGIREDKEGKQDKPNKSGIPLLYASRLELVDGSLHPMGFTLPLNKEPSFENALVENIATGATMVMNRAARTLICSGLERMSQPGVPATHEKPEHPDMKDILLHDWWCYLVISAFGKIVFDPESRILHRQHGGNTVGHKSGFLARQKRRLERFRKKRDVKGITRQASLFEALYGKDLPDREKRILRRFLAKDETVWQRICYAFKPDVVRQKGYDGLLMRLLILAGKL